MTEAPRSIVLLEGGHRTVVDGPVPSLLSEGIAKAREAGKQFYNPAGTSAQIDVAQVVAVVPDTRHDAGEATEPAPVFEQLALADFRAAVAEELRIMSHGGEQHALGGVISRLKRALETSQVLDLAPAGSAARERQEQEALEVLPDERLFREYLHRVIRRGRQAPNDYAAVVGLLDEFGR